MSTIELAIDFGSSFITIFQRGRGVVFKEPAIAIATKIKDKIELIETGQNAKKALSRSLGNAQVVYPIREGIIVHQMAATLLIKDFLKKILPSRLSKPRIKVLAIISCGLTVVERRLLETVLTKAGVAEVMIIENPFALLAYTNSIGGLFVDIGGGTAEIASVTKRGIAAGCAVNIAGSLFNSKIIDYIIEKYDLKIGDYTAENLKLEIASLYDNDINTATISGRDLVSGAPRTIEVAAKDIKQAIAPVVDDLIDVIESVLSSTPPELAAEIGRKGIFLCGGSAKLPGLTEYISVRLRLPVTELTDITEAAALGGGMLLSNPELINQMLNIK